jgi:signal transduction histidine kinase
VAEGIPNGLPKEISLCLFRVLQEALRNATQYNDSGELQVSLGVESDEIHLTVRYGGIGLDTEAIPEEAEFAFSIMRERLKLVDGDFSIDSQPQRGATIRARVPLATRMKSAGASE